MKGCYTPIKAKIEKIVDETPNIKTFFLRPETPIRFLAGQFIQLTVPGVGESPFTPSSSPKIEETMEVTVMRVGAVTNVLHNLKVGDVVGIRGPFGKNYPLEKFYGKEVHLIGGGVGMAPLRSLLLALISEIDKFKKIILNYGAKTIRDIVYKNQFQEWRKYKNVEISLCVDSVSPAEKWDGVVGVVTCLLEKPLLKVSDISNTVAVVCGPPIMMKFTTLKLLNLGYKPENIYLSMEKNMSCAVGKCGHCAIGPYFVCKDGPVFTYNQISNQFEIWD
jgi:NAD(P)H-flavin reductase